jgi:hypothetical protein
MGARNQKNRAEGKEKEARYIFHSLRKDFPRPREFHARGIGHAVEQEKPFFLL